jgi:hypothetical protein
MAFGYRVYAFRHEATLWINIAAYFIERVELEQSTEDRHFLGNCKAQATPTAQDSRLVLNGRVPEPSKLRLDCNGNGTS